MIKPGFIPHSNTFLRPLSNPASNAAAQFTSCIAPGTEVTSLLLNSCAAPSTGTIFGSGLIYNAYSNALAASDALLHGGSGANKAVIIGAAVGGAVGGAILIAFLAVAWLFIRRRRVLKARNRADEEGVELPEMEKRESGESMRSLADNAAAPGQSEQGQVEVRDGQVNVPPVEAAVGPVTEENAVPVRRSPNGRSWWKR